MMHIMKPSPRKELLTDGRNKFKDGQDEKVQDLQRVQDPLVLFCWELHHWDNFGGSELRSQSAQIWVGRVFVHGRLDIV